jgi:NADH:ubiquinone oxidoreductase subunit E
MGTGEMASAEPVLARPLAKAGPGPVGADPRISQLVSDQQHRPEGLIEVLHRLQALDGYLTKASLRQVAEELGLPLSRVYGVASFYHLFRLEPPQGHRCAVCLGSACFVLGASRLAVWLEQRLGLRLEPPAGSANGPPVGPGQARASQGGQPAPGPGSPPLGPARHPGGWSLEPVSCLGACGQAPLLVVDGALALRLPIGYPAALEARLDHLGLPRSPGSQAPGAKEPGAWGPALVLAGER